MGPQLLARWTVVLAVAAAVLTAGAFLAPRLAQAGGGSVAQGDGAVLAPPTALLEHRVVPGDTLWDLAVGVAGSEDPRDVIDRIMRLNGMQAPSLEVGDTVLLPNGT